ncbi:LemA family protein [Nitratifractor sp.]
METKSTKNYLLIFLSLLLVVTLGWFMLSYNAIVHKEEQVKTAWSQVESNLQRKLDLIPNLVRTVKAYAKHESDLLTKVTSLRSQATALLGEKLPDQTRIETLKKVQSQLDNATMKLFAVAENYPELRSSEQFLQLQSQIEGAENRINITRMQFNEAVGDFNAYLRHIPANIVAKFGGFHPKAYFKAEKKAHQILKVDL